MHQALMRTTFRETAGSARPVHNAIRGQGGTWCEMDNLISRDPVPGRFRAALAETYGDRLERAVLFGSRARGDFRPDSDYDIAVFIHDPEGWLDEVIRLASLGTSILLDTGAVISAKPFRAGAYNGNGALMRAIRGEGLDL